MAMMTVIVMLVIALVAGMMGDRDRYLIRMPVIVLVFVVAMATLCRSPGNASRKFPPDAPIAINSYHRQYGSYPSSAARLSQGDPAV